MSENNKPEKKSSSSSSSSEEGKKEPKTSGRKGFSLNSSRKKETGSDRVSKGRTKSFKKVLLRSWS